MTGMGAEHANKAAAPEVDVAAPSPTTASLGPGTRVSRKGPGGSRIQRRLGVGAVDDPYEREADRVADEVIQRLRRQVAEPVESEHAIDEPRKIRRKNETVADEDIAYGGKIDTLAETGVNILKKPKTLYKTKSLSAEVVAQLPAGKGVTVVEPPSGGALSRSWARVQSNVRGDTVDGFINTKDPTQHVDVQHTAVNEPAMSKDGPHVEDVQQHMLGTCFLLAPLMSLTRKDPQFVKSELFATDPTAPQPSFTVRFYPIVQLDERERDEKGYAYGPAAKPDEVTVSATLLRTTSKVVNANMEELAAGTNIGSRGAWPWPAVIEKAFAAWSGKLPADSGKGGQSARSSMYLTGEQFTKTKSIDSLDVREGRSEGMKLASQKAIIEAVQGGNPVSAATQGGPSDKWKKANESAGKGASGGEEMVGGIAFGHVYEVVAADENAITLRNPWGHYGRKNQKVVEDAESVLTWDEFWEVFSSDGVAMKSTPTKKGKK